MAEVVTDKNTGLHFHSGDASDLASKVSWLWHHPEESKRIGCEARVEYENKFTAKKKLRNAYGYLSTGNRKPQSY